jgi:hypothetical protein
MSGESKVCDLGDPIADEDIGWLEVSVDDAPAPHFPIACNHSLKDLLGELLGLLSLSGGQVSAFAELSDEVGVVGSLEHLVQLHYVGMVDEVEGFDL